MPHTFVHTLAVMPIKHKAFVTSALVIGSMSADFEYLIWLQARAEISHSVVAFCAGFLLAFTPWAMFQNARAKKIE
jgi:hypothetical protein